MLRFRAMSLSGITAVCAISGVLEQFDSVFLKSILAESLRLTANSVLVLSEGRSSTPVHIFRGKTQV